MNIYCFDWRRNPMPASDSKSIGFISFGFAVMYSMSNLAVRYLDSWNILVASAFPAKNSIHCRGAGSFRRGHPNFTLFSGSIPKKIYINSNHWPILLWQPGSRKSPVGQPCLKCLALSISQAESGAPLPGRGTQNTPWEICSKGRSLSYWLVQNVGECSCIIITLIDIILTPVHARDLRKTQLVHPPDKSINKLLGSSHSTDKPTPQSREGKLYGFGDMEQCCMYFRLSL